MKAREKHWLNPKFLAPNVIEIDVDARAFAPAADLIPEIQKINGNTNEVALPSGLRFNVLSMASEWASDILWISQGDENSYCFFNEIFRASGISDMVRSRVDYVRDLRLYSGFFVTRSFCTEADYHLDWIDANNNAFTFLMPLTSNCTEMGLSYVNARGAPSVYRYELGKALIFGDHFYHSTAPGRTTDRCVLMSFTFGTDRMEHWASIAKTATAQGRFYCRPDGTFVCDGQSLSVS